MKQSGTKRVSIRFNQIENEFSDCQRVSYVGFTGLAQLPAVRRLRKVPSGVE
jgi:hypothetical protein